MTRVRLMQDLEEAVAKLSDADEALRRDVAAFTGADDPDALLEILGLAPDEVASFTARRREQLGAERLAALVARIGAWLSAHGYELTPEHRRALGGGVEVEDTPRIQQGDLEGRLVAPVDPGGLPQMIGPVAMIAHLPPATLEPRALPVDADVRPHPHLGLAAISYLLDGHVTHRDSLGSLQEIGPGDVACTVAGRGIAHSERFERLRLHGGTLHLFQILLALADEAEDTDPAFVYVPSDEVAVERVRGVTVRRLAGPGSALEGRLPSPAFLHDVTLEAGASYDPPDAAERAVYVLSGTVDIDGIAVTTHQRALLAAPAVLTASSAARVLAFGGAHTGPRYSWWNYIHSSLDAIAAAKAAWRAGEIPMPHGDTESFTPAPPDDGRPLRLLNAADRG